MITRIYIDNFRSLVNFEWKPEPVALLLGANGSGRSSLVDALWGLRALVANQDEVKRWFPSSSRARWETRPECTIELDVRLWNNEHTYNEYSYKLTIEHSAAKPKSRITHETLSCGGKLLMEFVGGELQLFTDDGGRGPLVTSDMYRSGLGAIAAGKKTSYLDAFKEWIRNDLWLLKPDPRQMSARADEEIEELATDLSNFASWLPLEMTQDLNGVMKATAALREVIDGFQSLQVSRTAPRLEASLLSDGSNSYTVDFDELSDGQRQLCALYFVRHLIMKTGRLVILDEPDNYVALREIQPWLMEVLDLALSKNGPQIWVISHHPELINQLAPDHGVRFFRSRGPTRIQPFAGVEGLTAAETVARGWDGE